MRRLIIATLFVLAACGRAPSSPTPPPASPAAVPVAVADFSGYWKGTMNQTSCSGLRHCASVIGRRDPFSFRLQQRGSHVTGVFSTGTGIPAVVEVSGDVQADGSVALTGETANGGSSAYLADYRFTAPALRLDAAAGLSGLITLETHTVPSSSGDGTFTKGAAIVSADRGSLEAFVSDVSGTWEGRYLVRQCSDTAGRSSCSPYYLGEVEEFSLELTVAGDTVTGLIGQITANLPVSGRVRGRTIELADPRAPSAAGVSDRVVNFSASVDAFGRLVGRYTHVHVSNGITSTAEVDIVQVVRVP